MRFRGASPSAVGIVITDLRVIGRRRIRHMHEPTFGFGMDVHIGNGRRFFVASKNANNQVTITALGIVAGLLFRGEIPRDIQPMGVARGQEDAACAVSFGKFARAGKRSRSHGDGSEGVAGTRAAHSGRWRLVAFEKERRNLHFATRGRRANGTFSRFRIEMRWWRRTWRLLEDRSKFEEEEIKTN